MLRHPSRSKRQNLWKLNEAGLQILFWEKAGKPPVGPWLKNDFQRCRYRVDLFIWIISARRLSFSQWDRVKKEVLEEGWKNFVLFPAPPPSLKIFPFKALSDKETKSFKTASEALENLFRLESFYRNLLTCEDQTGARSRQGHQARETHPGKTEKGPFRG